MEEYRISWRNTIFIRSMITFVCIVFPIYLVALGIYSWAVSSMRSNISDSMLTQSQYFLSGFESDIQRIKVLQNDLFGDDNLNYLADASTIMNLYERNNAILELQKRLISIQKSSNYIEEVSVHIPAVGKTIQANAGISPLFEDEFAFFHSLAQSKYSVFYYWINVPYLMSSNLIRGGSDAGRSKYIVDIKLSEPEIAKSMQKLNAYDGGHSILIDENSSRYIFSDGIVEKDNNTIKILKDRIRARNNSTNASDIDTVIVENKKYFLVFVKSGYLKMILIKYVPETIVTNSIKKYQVFFWILTIMAFAVLAIYSFFTYRYINRPLLQLVKSFKKLEEGDVESKILHNSKDEFAYIFQSYNSMTEKLSELIRQVYEQKILAQNSELKQLQSQINPHFLYNSFFILHRMIRAADIEKAENFSEQLGNYFKYVTRNGQDEVPLEKEYEHARIYAQMQGIRFSRRIKIQFGELPDELGNFRVPRLILQPILENAFEHGLKEKEAGGLLSVTFNISSIVGGEYLLIAIEDNGDCPESVAIEKINRKLLELEHVEETTAIYNIHRRIRLKFGEESGLTMSKSNLGGLKVLLKLKIEKRDKCAKAPDC